MTTTTETCGKCDGAKTLTWTRIANGVCFACGGAGVLTVEKSELAAVRLPRAKVIAFLKADLDSLAKHVEAEGQDYGHLVWHETDGYAFGKTLGHADEDVKARAIAAFTKLVGANDVLLHNLERDAKGERSVLAAKVRKVVKSVRKVA